MSCDSDREQLGGKGMGFPPVIAEQSQLEGLEQRQHTPNMQAVQGRLQLCDLLEDGMGTAHINLIDFRVVFP